MKRALTSFAIVLLSCAGCAPGTARGPADAEEHSLARLGMSKEAMENARKAERDMYTRILDGEQERIDKLETKTLKALRVSLGKEPARTFAMPSSRSRCRRCSRMRRCRR